MEFIARVKLPSGTVINLFELEAKYGENSSCPGIKIIQGEATLPSGEFYSGILSSKLVAEKAPSQKWEEFLPAVKKERDLYWSQLQFDNGRKLELFYAAKQKTQIAAVTL
jgi:hypothetical protein